MAKTIYISGKMGEKRLSKATIEKFKKAQEKMLAEGWSVINPANPQFQNEAQIHVSVEEKKWVDLEFGHFDWYSWMLLWDLHNLALCEAIYMLKDWKDSPGATAEHAYAKACGKIIFYEEEE